MNSNTFCLSGSSEVRLRLLSAMPENGLELGSIRPEAGEAFSPNLFKFLKARPDVAAVGQVYRDRNGVLWMGYEDRPYFIGVRMMEVLCRGRKAQTGAFATLWPMQIVEDFWKDYAAVGRCAIDPGHREHFLGSERWVTKEANGRMRTCAWCGLSQMRREAPSPKRRDRKSRV